MVGADIRPHTSPARTLYHSKRLKDPQTKDAFTSALALKVAKISHTLTPVAGPIFETKIESFFLESFFSGEELLPENRFLGQ